MDKRAIAAGLFFASSFAVSHSAGLFDWLFGRRDVEVITVTDMTPAGRLLQPATPQNPVYYVAYELGFQDLGGIVGGDKIPPKEEAKQIITKALAMQGYLPATQDTPAPTLFLTLTWGTLNTELFFGGNPDLPPRQLNRQQILKFLGGYKVGFSDGDFDPLLPPLGGLSVVNNEAQTYLAAAEDDYYISVVAAYDLRSVIAAKRQLLWITRISCPSRGFWLHDVMPTMLAIGSPHFGRESVRPTWVNASDRFKAEVRMGDLKFLDGDAPSTPNLQEAKPEAAKPAGK
jgi:hypothetical protein